MNRYADCLRWGGRQSIPNQTGQHMSILGRSGNAAGEVLHHNSTKPLNPNGSGTIRSWSFRHHLTVKSAGYCVAAEKSAPRIFQYASLLFFPGALSPTDFPGQNSYSNLWSGRRYRWHPSSAENRASQPVISTLIQNWIMIKLTKTLSQGSLFFVYCFTRKVVWSAILPYVRKSGRCFVAAVEIETDRCAVCLAELDVVQSEADIQANVRWTRAGNKQSPDILSLPICVSLFAANMDVSRETLLLTKFNGNGEILPITKK